ncbi:hypothetical protein GH714_005505 [Hevea brasiliensis]|uniref:Uncharacterized protein n=1 Tax=Hevea brasiliensis TaxID=3981 RepID=A0A6A6K9S7_HEVBR|nr:hypothetical protein GH714_005505 [Hevea brasiliensis]
MAANVFDIAPENEGKANSKNEMTSVDWASMIQHEIAKYMQNQNPVVNEASCVNFTGFASKDFSGYSSSSNGKSKGTWIVDSGLGD